MIPSPKLKPAKSKLVNGNNSRLLLEDASGLIREDENDLDDVGQTLRDPKIDRYNIIDSVCEPKNIERFVLKSSTNVSSSIGRQSGVIKSQSSSDGVIPQIPRALKSPNQAGGSSGLVSPLLPPAQQQQRHSLLSTKSHLASKLQTPQPGNRSSAGLQISQINTKH